MPSFLAIIVLLKLTTSIKPSSGARQLTSLYPSLTYHHGPLLEVHLPISILWYGHFSPSQKSIISDFFLSLNPTQQPGPNLARWWQTLQNYLNNAGKKGIRVTLSNQVIDEGCSLGKTLSRSQLAQLSHRVDPKSAGLTLVLTADNVAVEGFCMSSCGFHGSDSEKKSAYIWVGNSVSQYPGQCAWPFHLPIYGPYSPLMVAPNGDVGMDGMVVNIASLLANTITNPFSNGYYQGESGAPIEVASACTRVYGKGAFPGYAGQLLVDSGSGSGSDSGSGSSYNAYGVNGRKYLLPLCLTR